MDRKLLLAMLLAGLLISAPFVRADEEDYDDDSDDAEEKKDGDDEPHVKVLGAKNWDETVGKAKYALVRAWAGALRAQRRQQRPNHHQSPPLISFCF